GASRDLVERAIGPGADQVTLDARLNEENGVVTLTATAAEPAIAARGAQALNDVLVDSNNDARDQARQERLDDATAIVEGARQRLADFVNANGPALGAPVAPPALQIELDALEADVAAAEAALRDEQTAGEEGLVYRSVKVGEATKDVKSKLQLPADTRLRVVLGLLIGLVGAVAIVAFVEKLNPRIDDPSHAERLIGAPVLAMVPVMNRRRGKVLKRVDPATFTGPFAESFRALRSHLDFRNVADERTSPARVLVVSAAPGEGKTTTAAFLSYSYTEVGQDPIVVGGDVRRPTVHHLFEVPRIPGLSSLEAGPDLAASVAEIVTRDPVSGVNVVPSGPAVDRVTGLLSRLATITRAGQRAGRPVVVDSAPLMVANDTVDYLSCVDWVIVVVRLGRSTERSIKQTIATLRLNEADIVGCVMVGSLESADAKRYYYSYYAPEDAKPAKHRGEAPAREREREVDRQVLVFDTEEG
ncbi:MAG TPA: hypothetical protein VHK88_03675, partial [Aquihabitans sp.]|nr:hypothetical protein [Aquihabitans sp.]